MVQKLANGIVGMLLLGSAGVGIAAGIPGYIPFSAPTFSGSGCSKDTVAFQAGEDAFTLLFTEAYQASAGAGIKPKEAVKTCIVRMNLEVPAGYQVAIDTLDYNGFVDATVGAAASFYSWYTLTGQAFVDVGTSKESRFKGPIFDEDGFPGKTWQRRDVSLNREANRWSRCGGKHVLTMSSQMVATARRGASALIKLDAADGVASLRYGTSWRRCKM